MLRSFAHFGVDKTKDKVLEDTDGRTYMCTLRLMSDKRSASPQHGFHSNVDVSSVIRSDSKSTADTQVNCLSRGKNKYVSAVDEKGVLLDASREVRVKLYMGQVPLGWVYFIPTFHMPPSSSKESQKSHLLFTRNEIDLPLGTWSGIMDIEIDVEMEWVIPLDP